MKTPQTEDHEQQAGCGSADAACSARRPDSKMDDFRKQLEALLNRASMEERSNTPDFILAHYMADCLEAHDRAVNRREVWFGRKTTELDSAPNAEVCQPEGGKKL